MMVTNELRGTRVGGMEVFGAELAEDFTTIARSVESLLEKESPAVCVSLGWDDPPWIKVEMIAINVMSARVGDKVIPDHAGNKPDGEPVVPGGPVAYVSTLPTGEMIQSIRRAGLPAFTSYETSTNVRNATMYSMLHWASARKGLPIAGLIHVPPLPGMFGPDEPAMSLASEVQAVRIALAVCAKAMRGDRQQM